MNLEELKFTEDHEWVRREGKRAVVGVSDYAQDQLGDIVYVEMPELNAEVSTEDEISEVESTKTTAPVLSPVSGRVVEINDELTDNPEMINEDPYGKGWIAVIEMSDPSELENLMDYKEYGEFIEEESHEDELGD
ncbi:MAG: glycine cleavage system protein GcvH [Candidatus Aminicenantes bacterium]|nr:glycine cleavage system protein GcvH [Candidatus Aminicenantes bacterium]